MTSIKIDNCAFGSISINSKTYREDLMIRPDGSILKPWWRKQGHLLAMEDLKQLIDAAPEIIIVGTGINGRVTLDKTLKSELAGLNIELIALPNEKAIKVFNQMALEKKIGGGFHLTC